MKTLYTAICLTIFIFLNLDLMAQNIQVDVQVVGLGHENYAGEGRAGASYRFYHTFVNSSNNLSRESAEDCGGSPKCIYRRNTARGCGHRFEREEAIGLIPFQVNQNATGITLMLTTHNERKSNSCACSANTDGLGDNFETTGEFPFAFSSFVPGRFSPAQRLENAGPFDAGCVKRAWADVLIKYSIPTPHEPQLIQGNDGFNCVDQSISIGTGLPNEFAVHEASMEYQWEYYTDSIIVMRPNPDYALCFNNCQSDCFTSCGGDITCLEGCDTECTSGCSHIPAQIPVQVPNWRVLRIVTSSPELAINNPLQELFGGTLSQNASVGFRVKAFSDDSSSYSAGFLMDFSPLPPIYQSIDIANSCPNIPSGSVTIQGMQSRAVQDDFLYILQDGTVTVPVCEPENLQSGCSGAVSSGFIPTSQTNLTIDQLSPGDYTLWLANSGVNAGVCITPVYFTIGTHPLLTTSNAHTDVSCQGATDGTINLNGSGGFGAYAFQLLDSQGQEIIGNQGEFTNLRAGTYQSFVRDACGQVVENLITIIEPTRITGSITTANASCQNPGNGQLIAEVNEGSGTYNFQLFSEGVLIHEFLNSPSLRWELNNLPSGDYSLEVRDAVRPICEGYSATFSIQDPEPLSITSITSENLSCFQGESGSISFEAEGGGGNYIYRIIRESDESAFENSSGKFINLSADRYSLEVSSGLTGCSDFYVHPESIELSEPQPILINTSVDSIACHGDQSGSISASVSGGNAPYQYRWEVLLDESTWTSMSNTQANLTQQPGGIYRVIVEDANNCSIASEPIQIFEPDLLNIVQVLVNRPDCDSEFAFLEVSVEGGLGEYQLMYAPIGTQGFQELSPTTPIPTGNSYQIRVADQNACTQIYSDEIVIDANALSLNVSSSPACYLQSNGEISIQVSGGISPYQYSIDDGESFQEDNVFTDLDPGFYNVSTLDSRGCEGNTQITVTRRPEEPEANFLVATSQNALDTLVVLELSIPKADFVEWIYDPQAIVINDDPWSPQIKFESPGTYQMGMIGHFGECSYTIIKDLVIAPFDPDATNDPGIRPIQEFAISPNPNHGNFNVQVRLNQSQFLSLILMNTKGEEFYREAWKDVDQLEIDLDFPELSSGTYILRAITDQDAQEIRVIITP